MGRPLALAFRVGLVSALYQSSLIYSQSLLCSATALAYLKTMLLWFLGGAAGCWLPAKTLSLHFLFLLAGAFHFLNTALLANDIFVPSWIPAAVLGGSCASHWLSLNPQPELGTSLFFETLGMAAGFLLSFVLVYSYGVTYIWWVPLAGILIWKGDNEVQSNSGL